MPERGSKKSTVPVVWATFEIFSFGAIQLISCRARLVTMDGTWLYRCNPETMQQSMDWRHSGPPRPAPKNSECRKPLEKFSSRFFGLKTASSSLIIFQRAKLSTRSITHLCWCNCRRNAAGRSPRGLVLARQFPGSPGTCNREETGLPGLPMSWSPTLFSGSGPVGLHLFPGLKKTIERSQFFVRRGSHCCRGDLVGRTSFWFFFWVVCKS